MKHDAPHPSDEALLCAIDDELSPSGRATIEAHLDVCAQCQARMQTLRAASDDALHAVREEAAPPPEALEAMRERLVASLSVRSAELERSWLVRAHQWLSATSSGPIVAAALLACAAFVVFSVLVRDSTGKISPLADVVEAGALPIRALTPGATARVTADELCDGIGPTKEVIAPAVREAVLRDYGMAGLPESEYELDYLITPELGGSSDRRNLWPERYGSRLWDARVKDELEQLLPSLVCRGTIDLSTAQRDIAHDWIAAYKKYFQTDRPVTREARVVQEE